MKKKSFWKDTVIVGLALFSTMFGAGNLIFPPQIGLFSGQEWFLGAMGLANRTEKGTLIEVGPYYTHSYGKFVPEIIEIDKQLREIMFGGDK